MKLLHLPLVVLLASCAGSKKDQEDSDKPKAPDQRIVGRIASVSKAGKFVLIQKYGTGILPASALYQSRGSDGRTAALRPSGERVRDFFAADLLSGNPQKGDAVLAYSLPKTEKEPGEETPAPPDGTDTNAPKLPTKNEAKEGPDSKNIKEEG